MTWALLVAGLANVVFGFVVFRHARNRTSGRIFLALQIASASWAWGIALFMSSQSLAASQLFVNSYYLSALAIASGVLAFSIVDMRGRAGPLALIACYFPPALALLAFMVDSTLLVQVVSTTGTLTERVVIHTAPYLAYAATFVLYYGISLIIFIRNIIKSSGIEKRSRQVIVAGIVVTSIFGLAFNLILPWLGQYNLIGIGPLITIIFSVSVAYSILKYSMFDLRQSFSVSLSYGFSFAIVAIIYGVTIGLIGALISSWGKNAEISQITYVVTALVAGIIFQPLQKAFNVITDSLFFRNEYSSEDVLNKLGEIISEADSLEHLLVDSLSLLNNNLKPTSIDFVFADKAADERNKSVAIRFDHELIRESCLNFKDQIVIVSDEDPSIGRALLNMHVGLVVTLKTTHGLIGYLLLSEKQSGEAYSFKDISMLEVAADTLSVAIENALRYEEIKHFNQTLTERVDEATAELKATNKRLKQLDQTKDEFISLTSHQLRTPLTTIKGYISMLLDGDAGEVSPQQRKLLEEAFNSSQRMVHLISDFLNISRIQTGKFMIELTDVNLAEVLDEEIEQLRISATSRQINLSYDKPLGFPTMPLDDGKIRQVMMNFIDNAIYYSPAGSTITVVLSHTATTVEFKVIDQGIGVPKAEQHKLFAKFSRASNARKQRPDGTGIGLFMAKKVIVALGGAIIFQSEEGKGSTFGFRLNRPKS